MTKELECSRALMDKRYEELQPREEIMQITIRESVQFTLEEYIKNNPVINVNAADLPDPLTSRVIRKYRLFTLLWLLSE